MYWARQCFDLRNLTEILIQFLVLRAGLHLPTQAPTVSGLGSAGTSPSPETSPSRLICFLAYDAEQTWSYLKACELHTLKGAVRSFSYSSSSCDCLSPWRSSTSTQPRSIQAERHYVKITQMATTQMTLRWSLSPPNQKHMP